MEPQNNGLGRAENTQRGDKCGGKSREVKHKSPQKTCSTCKGHKDSSLSTAELVIVECIDNSSFCSNGCRHPAFLRIFFMRKGEGS